MGSAELRIDKRATIGLTAWQEQSADSIKSLLEDGFAASCLSYIESVSACCLVKGFKPPPTDAIQGHWFNGEIDIRWRRRKDGTFDAWRVRELAAKPDPKNGETGHQAIVTERPYYLIGRSTGTSQLTGQGDAESTDWLFREQTFGAFWYPKENGSAKGDDRAYIVVALYMRTEPDWGSIQDAEAIDEEFSAPMLIAHRFVRLGVGHDKEEARGNGT